jgi:pilus assembly protein CpaB
VIENPGNVAIQIPDGYRAMPVKVDEDTVMKAISPGDRVDVMVFLRKGGEIPTTGIFTILKNVRVFAINTETQRSLDPERGPTNFRTVSLLVKPDHAREVGVAAQIGKILLTLRNPDQKDEEGGETITPLRDLLAGPAHQGSSRASTAAGNPPPILDTLRASAPAAGGDAKWHMLVLGPDGANQYEWTDLQGLPVQSQPRSLPPAPQPRSSEPPPAPEGDTDVAPGAKQPGEEKKPAGNPQDDAARWWQY